MRLSCVWLRMSLDFCCWVCIYVIGRYPFQRIDSLKLLYGPLLADRVVPSIGICPFGGSTHELFYICIISFKYRMLFSFWEGRPHSLRVKRLETFNSWLHSYLKGACSLFMLGKLLLGITPWSHFVDYDCIYGKNVLVVLSSQIYYCVDSIKVMRDKRA